MLQATPVASVTSDAASTRLSLMLLTYLLRKVFIVSLSIQKMINPGMLDSAILLEATELPLFGNGDRTRESNQIKAIEQEERGWRGYRRKSLEPDRWR